VFTLALTALLALMMVPALTALRRSEQIYRDIRASQEQFEASQRAFEALAQNVFAISITVREFLLDNSPDAGRTYLSRYQSNAKQLRTSIEVLRQNLPPGETEVLQRLDRELSSYGASILPIFDWTTRQRTDRGAFFLREEQRPRRQSVLAIAGELADLNLSLYREQQRRINDSEREFRSGLQRSWLYALLTGIVVSAAAVLRIRWLERRTREQHQHVEQTGEEMRNLSIRLRHAQEEERRTISRELHDEIGQKLTAMRMELGTLERLRTSSTNEFGACLGEVKAMAEDSLRMIRDIAAGLRPSVLDDLGLGAALQKQGREFSKRTGTPVSVAVEGEFQGLSDRQRTYIYRIVQEALTNCAKHSSARQITIRLFDAGHVTELAVIDDGVGFDPDTAAHSGLGLIGIEERVRELRGSLAILSAPGRGATLKIRIPRNGNGT
jgi:signal transduction histidine kinase